jgi:aspartyl aminopeptidase
VAVVRVRLPGAPSTLTTRVSAVVHLPRTPELLDFLDGSPSPHHAVAEALKRLHPVTVLDERDRWPTAAGRYAVVRGGSLVAWNQPAAIDPGNGVRIVGAHTDSPNLRLKPHPDADQRGWRRVSVEPYGGVLWNSWLDRDLGLSGRLVLSNGDAEPEVHLVRINEPWLRIPQLAIHLDRSVNTEGLRLDSQRDLSPIWGVAEGGPGIVARVAEAAGLEPSRVVAAELMCHDLQAPAVTGVHGEFISSARIDNLVSCWAATQALAQTDPASATPASPVPMICLFDHEEIGSQSASGAASTLLYDVVMRLGSVAELDAQDTARLRASSFCVSADGAHATHPNRPERHDERHPVRVNAGVVVKHNANVRYATDATGLATIRLAAQAVDVTLQDFVMRNDLTCGSTIGPITAAGLGITTVDVGVPQLAMHSARELCGTEDADHLADLLAAVLAGP